MYLLRFEQFRYILYFVAATLIAVPHFFTAASPFIEAILGLAGISLLLFASLVGRTGKKFFVFAIFLISIFLSFSHFLLNFSRDPVLVPLVYSTSFLTLLSILVTNFQEDKLINH